MNISRSRRLIVLLSHAYLEQDWCTNNFRSDKLNTSTKSWGGVKNVWFRAVWDAAWLRSTTWGQCCYHVLQRVEFVCPCLQTGPPALDGVVSASNRLHPAGGPVQTHEAWHQAAAQGAAALPERSHLETQLCGTICCVNTKLSGANKDTMSHLLILSSFLSVVLAFLSSTDTVV